MSLKHLMARSVPKYILGLILLIIIIGVHMISKYDKIYTVATAAAIEKQTNAIDTLNLATENLTNISVQMQHDSVQIQSNQNDLHNIQKELLQLVKTFEHDMVDLKKSRQLQIQLLQQIYDELRVSNGAVTDIPAN
jgi:translation initiation factor 2B subunit (eIF-2B alpha/beta/delta family)